jgi:excisionase family DNA binding protein
MELLTVQETAVILKASPVTVRRFIKSRRLPAVRVGRSLRVRREDVESLPLPANADEPPVEEVEVGWGLFTKDDPLWDLVGMLGDEDDGVDDVSSNKHKYLLEAYSDLHEGK